MCTGELTSEATLPSSQVTSNAVQLALPHLSSSEVILEERGLVEVKGAPEPFLMYLVVPTSSLPSPYPVYPTTAAAVTQSQLHSK